MTEETELVREFELIIEDKVIKSTKEQLELERIYIEGALTGIAQVFDQILDREERKASNPDLPPTIHQIDPPIKDTLTNLLEDAIFLIKQMYINERAKRLKRRFSIVLNDLKS